MHQDIADQLTSIDRQLLHYNFHHPIQDVAAAWNMKWVMHAPHIPSVTSYSCEPLEQLVPKLLDTLHTPTGDTPYFKPHMAEDVATFNKVMAARDHCEYWGVLYHDLFHWKATGHEDIGFCYYDIARDYPQYAERWRENLKRQYGTSLRSLRKQYPELFHILNETQRIADEREANSIEVNLATAITFELSAIKLEHAEQGNPYAMLRAATASGQSKFYDYRRKVAQLRGIRPELNAPIDFTDPLDED